VCCRSDLNKFRASFRKKPFYQAISPLIEIRAFFSRDLKFTK
jgi:hypothetical protein